MAILNANHLHRFCLYFLSFLLFLLSQRKKHLLSKINPNIIHVDLVPSVSETLFCHLSHLVSLSYFCIMTKVKKKKISVELNVLYTPENNPWIGRVQYLTSSGTHFPRDFGEKLVL